MWKQDSMKTCFFCKYISTSSIACNLCEKYTHWRYTNLNRWANWIQRYFALILNFPKCGLKIARYFHYRIMDFYFVGEIFKDNSTIKMQLIQLYIDFVQHFYLFTNKMRLLEYYHFKWASSNNLFCASFVLHRKFEEFLHLKK